MVMSIMQFEGSHKTQKFCNSSVYLVVICSARLVSKLQRLVNRVKAAPSRYYSIYPRTRGTSQKESFPKNKINSIMRHNSQTDNNSNSSLKFIQFPMLNYQKRKESFQLYWYEKTKPLFNLLISTMSIISDDYLHFIRLLEQSRYKQLIFRCKAQN